MRLLASCSPGEVRVAVVDDHGLVDIAIWRPGAPDGVGDLYRAHIAARVPAMAGAFVRLEGSIDGFLPDSEGGSALGEGMVLGVRITRAAQGGKGPRLTARLTDPERALVGVGVPAPAGLTASVPDTAAAGSSDPGAGTSSSAATVASGGKAARRVTGAGKGTSSGAATVASGGAAPRGLTGAGAGASSGTCVSGLSSAAAPGLVRRGPGAVERLALQHPGIPVCVDDLALAAALRPVLGDQLRIVAAAFDDEVESAFASLAEASADLPGGARLSVHPTPALTAIDIDLGAATGARATKGRAQMAANLALLPALARQIRLRNLSGAILVDFGGLSASRRPALRPALAEALAHDPGRPRLLGFTALGLAEIVRPRVHPPLHDMLAGPHAAGLAALRAAAGAVAAAPHRAPVLRAAPSVVAALQADPVALAAFQGRAGRPISLRADPTLPGAAWQLED